MVVAFTGYRPEKMPFQESKGDKQYLAFRTVLSRVISRLIESGGTHFISGVARGFDTWGLEYRGLLDFTFTIKIPPKASLL